MFTLQSTPVGEVSDEKPPAVIRETNKVQPQDRAIHEWYRFVLSYPPHLVRDYLAKFELRPGATVLDPFAGTGTTLVEAKRADRHSIGIECHPMGHFASGVKTDWQSDPEALVRAAEKVVEAAAQSLKLSRSSEDLLRRYDETIPAEMESRTLPEEQHRLLLKNSISPAPLHKVLALRDALDCTAPPHFRSHLRLALAKAIVADASNLEFGPEVGLGKIKEDAPVLQSWLDRVGVMASDLRRAGSTLASTKVLRGDARNPQEHLEPQSIDAVITSPPYPNEKDYTRTTRLESVLLGFISSKKELRALKQGLIRSNTRNIYRADEDDRWVSQFDSIQKIAAEIEQRRLDLGKTSGFERLYHRVAKQYFGGMARHLANLRPLLRPGARLAYVVGDQASFFRILIRTGQLLAEIAQDLGYEVEGIDLFRTRIATATKAMLREEVLRLRWPG